ncbi:MAG: hypothetical protein AAB322_04725, partial [Pseudomonadota bacterium]
AADSLSRDARALAGGLVRRISLRIMCVYSAEQRNLPLPLWRYCRRSPAGIPERGVLWWKK